MNSSYTRVALISLFGVLCLSMPAGGVYAEDFNFRVPFEINNVCTYNITCARVHCNVMTAEGRIIGHEERLLSSTSGDSISGTLSFSFNAYPGKDRRDARKYECILNLESNASPKVDPSRPMKLATSGDLPHQ